MDTRYSDLPGEPVSVWLATTPETDFPPLDRSLTVDVAIVGGGLAGLTAATLLKAAGRTVAVIEARRIVHGVTGNTTAKITSLHTLIYRHLIKHFGEDRARAYGEANQTAIEQIAQLVQERNIGCDFRRTRAYTYADKESEVQKLLQEVNASLLLGLPAEFTEEVPLPYPVEGAVTFANQAQFHPRKYLLALARQLPGEGCHIFENTRTLDVDDGEPCTVTTEHGALTASAVITATNFPFGDKGLYSARLVPHRSYVLGLQLPEPLPAGLLGGMFISSEATRSVRTQPTAGGDLLLVGGEGHRAGEGGDTAARYLRLEEWALERFGPHRVVYRWSTQDNQTPDRVPYVGKAAPGSSNVYVATGFGGWGMTNSTVAGMLLRDLILGRDNPWAEVYDPNRLKTTGIGQVVRQGASYARHFVLDRLDSSEPESIGPGEGGIVRGADGAVAFFRAEDGTVSRLSPVCTHMGCFVTWNGAERSWDCPCHGSRYSTTGEVIHGPAIKPLREIGEDS
jgi:glycine/D-amino acid oxidase-like deaminating enzyme/nitrite reductase/ring-hydroxylating ferredoxin subunit